MASIQGVPRYASIAAQSIRHEGLGFLALWFGVWNKVPGWFSIADARFLYALAHHGPGTGSIVEIGSAFGRSTIFLARGSKSADREKVYAIDPHSEYAGSYEGFLQNLQRFRADDWAIPIVSTSTEAFRKIETGSIRLLFIDGLHTYEGVKEDIDNWVPLVKKGGIVVFDDYFNPREDVGVRRAVDELVATSSVESVIPVPYADSAVAWTRKR